MRPERRARSATATAGSWTGGPTLSRLSRDSVELGPYAHYMQKEIFEQPGAVANTLEMVVNAQSLQPNLFGAEAEAVFART